MSTECPVHAGQVALSTCAKCKRPTCAYCVDGGDLCEGCRARDEGGLVPWEDASRNWAVRFFATIGAVTKRSGVLFHRLEPGSGGMAVGFTALMHALIFGGVMVVVGVSAALTEMLGGGGDPRLLWTILMAFAVGLPSIVIGAMIGYAVWGLLHHIGVSMLGGTGNLQESIRTASYASAIGWLWVVVPFVMLVPIAGWVLGGCAMIFHLLFVSLALVSLGIGRFGMRPNSARIAGFIPAALYMLVILAYVLLVWRGTNTVESPDVYY